MSTTAAGGSTSEQSKNKLEGDEELAGMSLTTCRDDDESGGDTPVSLEMIDPAIVEVRGSITKPLRFTYTRERLLEISELPLSKIRPKFLESALNDGLGGICLLERNHSERKRPDTPNEDNLRNEMPTESHVNKRRGGDPRERIRKELDGIVLSPQRRSFNLGCSAPLSSASSRSGRPESPLGKTDLIHRPEIGSRRIGSGRIVVTRDVSWDYKGDNESQEYNFRPGGGSQMTRERRETDRDRDDRFDRRSFGRDLRDFEREKDRHTVRNGSRFSSERRRQISESKEDEPEWFSGGPTSQTDTIELRGFDDIPEERNNGRKSKIQAPQKKKNSVKETNNNNNSNNNNQSNNSIKEQSPPQRKLSNESKGSVKEDSPPRGPGGRSTPNKPQEQVQITEPEHSPVKETINIVREERLTEQGLFNKNIEIEVTLEIEQTNINTTTSNINKPSAIKERSQPVIEEQPDLLEDFLKMDSSFVGFLPNGCESEDTGGSRFQRWFTRESPTKQHESRRSSLQDEIINNMIKDITDTNIVIPHLNESDTYFAPISPAAASICPQTNTSAAGPIGPPSSSSSHSMPNNLADKPATNLLVELLKVGKSKSSIIGNNDLSMKNLSDVPGKVLSLEEIEAQLRRGNDKMPNNSNSSQNTSLHSKSDEDMAAFKRLLAQVSGGHAIPATNGPIPQKAQPPMTLLQMLNKSQQDENALRNSTQHMPMNPPQIPPELVMKLHQVQQQQRHDIMNKLLQANVGIQNRQYQASPLPSEFMNSNTIPTSANLELLQRPEAQAIIQGLKRGDITPQHLRQQLANPAIQPRHRDMILSVLKLHTGAGLPHQPSTLHPTPRAVSPGGPHPELLQQLMFQQQQQLRVSPLPPNAIPQRIPSPRELQQHTQNIMQQALIKKKLEEQRENYRKKQESMQQRSMSPATSNIAGHGTSPAKHLSPTPHSFTPTSVLRKMTASKETESASTALPKDKTNSLNSTALIDTNVKQMGLQQSSNQQSQMQGRAVTGMRQPSVSNSQQSQLQQINWNTQPAPIKQGRPILKGNNYQQYNTGVPDYQTRNLSHLQQSNQNMSGNLNAVFAQMQNQQRSVVNPNSVGQPNNSMNTGNNYLQSGGLRTGNVNNMNNTHSRPHPSLQVHFQQLQRSGAHPTLQQLLQMQGQTAGYNETRGIPITGRSNNPIQFNNRGSPLTDSISGDLSPTSNQLARWFPPELLAQARAGKLPDLPPVSVAQNARSLEELERIQQAAAAVHN